jgi:hypothetical protein
MLPTADAAAIAFAEVSSFMGFWIERNGPHALPLLLRDLAFTKDADSAMRSVSGLSVEDWEVLYRRGLEELEPSRVPGVADAADTSLGRRDLARSLRVSELLELGGHFSEALRLSSHTIEQAPHVAALRFLAQRANLHSGAEEEGLLGDLDDVSGPHAGWLALKASSLSPGQSSPESREMQQFALELDPFLPEAACGGGDPESGLGGLDLTEAEKLLCDHVRRLPPRGSR